MTLNSFYLEAFFVCAQTRHFTRAAERLHITQSALSQRIKNLEQDLEVTLIIRDRAGLRLTEEGEMLLRYCQTKDQLETQIVGSLKNKVDGKLSGIVRIGGYSSVMRSVLLPSLDPLIKSHSGLRLKTVTRELYELRSMMKSGEIDFLVLDEQLDQENIVSHILGHEENVLVKKKGTGPSNIYLDHDEEDQTTAIFLKKRSSHGLDRHYLDDIYGIIDGIRLGLGCAVVPKHLIKNEKMIEVIRPDRVLRSPVVLHYYSQPIYSRLHGIIVETLQKNCQRFLTP